MSNIEEVSSSRASKSRGRGVMPLSSGGAGYVINGEPAKPIKPGQSARISSQPASMVRFDVDRLVISGPGHEHWMIDELTIDGASMISGPIRTADLQGLESGMGRALVLDKLTRCEREIVFVVTYKGDNEDGRHFGAVAIGDIVPLRPAT